MSENADAAGPVAHAGWLRRNGVLVIGIALVVIGVAVLVLVSGMAPVAIGWFAYAPLAETILVASPPLWQEPSFLGLGITVLGLIIIAADLGYRAGRRRAAS